MTGRLPVITVFDDLNKKMLKDILITHTIPEYTKMLAVDDGDLYLTDGAIDAIIEAAIKRKTGARSLRALMEKILLNITYRFPDETQHTQIIFNEEIVKKYLNEYN